MTFPEALETVLLVLVVYIGLSVLAHRLRAVEHKLSLIMSHLQIDPASHVSRRVTELAADPVQRIAAIKAFRAETGLGLKEAADAVNELSRRAKRTR